MSSYRKKTIVLLLLQLLLKNFEGSSNSKNNLLGKFRIVCLNQDSINPTTSDYIHSGDTILKKKISPASRKIRVSSSQAR